MPSVWQNAQQQLAADLFGDGDALCAWRTITHHKVLMRRGSPELWQTLCTYVNAEHISHMRDSVCVCIDGNANSIWGYRITVVVATTHDERAPNATNTQYIEAIFIISDVCTYCMMPPRTCVVWPRNCRRAGAVYMRFRIWAQRDLGSPGYFRFKFLFCHKFNMICQLFFVCVKARVQLSEWRQVCIIYHCLLVKSYCSRGKLVWRARGVFSFQICDARGYSGG